MTNGPNPFTAAWSMLSARRLKQPNPHGDAIVDHTAFGLVLSELSSVGIGALAQASADLDAYRDDLSSIDPDNLSPSHALAFWINLYNAGALRRAGSALSNDQNSVLRVPGAFSTPWATIGTETLSLDGIEHGKIRRFADPRIHGALVCGSVSCPTLRNEPFSGDRLDAQLDDQMRFFLANGGATYDAASNVLLLSRVLKWYGRDFVRPSTMPTLLPARSKDVAMAISQWLNPEDAAMVRELAPGVQYAPYDWGLGCSVA